MLLLGQAVSNSELHWLYFLEFLLKFEKKNTLLLAFMLEFA